MRVVILGAKPRPTIPEGDAIYCANAAFLSAPDVVAGFALRSIVASATILSKGLASGTDNPAIYRTKVDAIRDFDSTELVLFGDPGRGDRLPAIRDYVTARQPGRALRIISVSERTQLVRERLGSYPLIDAEFRTQPLAIQGRDAIEICRWWVAWQLGSRRRDVRAKYRPSTGILALLVALADYGESAEYVMAGIGLADRHAYSIGEQDISNAKQRKSGALPMHTVADAIALRRLRDRLDLSATEAELHGLVRAFA